MIVAIATSLTTYIPMMRVPNFQIGEKVIAELKEIASDTFVLVSGGSDFSDVAPYTDWAWRFQKEK